MEATEDIVDEAFERYAICVEDGHLSEQQAFRIVMKQYGTVVLAQMKKKYLESKKVIDNIER